MICGCVGNSNQRCRSQIHLSLVRHLGGPQDSVADDEIELDPSEIEEV